MTAMHHFRTTGTALAAALALALTGCTDTDESGTSSTTNAPTGATASTPAPGTTTPATTGPTAPGTGDTSATVGGTTTSGSPATPATLPPSVKQLTDDQVRALPEVQGLGPLPRVAMDQDAHVVVTQDGSVTLPGGARAVQEGAVASPGGTAVIGAQGEVWFVRSGSTQATQLLAGRADVSVPALSPDATRFAVAEGGGIAVYSLPAGTRQRLHGVDGSPRIHTVLWNAAGVVFSTTDRLAVMNPETGATRSVRSGGEVPVLISGKDPRVELFLTEGADSEAVIDMSTLTRAPGRDNDGHGRAWSPDGRYVLLGTHLVDPVTLKDVTRTPMRPYGETDYVGTALTSDALYFYWRLGEDLMTARHVWVRCELADLTQCRRGRIH